MLGRKGEKCGGNGGRKGCDAKKEVGKSKNKLGAWCNPASLRAPVKGMIRKGSSEIR